MSAIVVTAFRWVPPFAQGLVRDLRVRWALEEAGLAYEERLIGPEDQGTEAYRQRQPFGQVPVLEQDGLALFESGAIVLHLAEQSPRLLPTEPKARLRARTWMFAALSTVEPPILALNALGMKAPANDGVVPSARSGRRPGRPAPRQPRRVPRRQGPPRRRFQRRRPADDDGAARPARHRPGGLAPGAARLPGALRSAAGVPASAAGAARHLRAPRPGGGLSGAPAHMLSAYSSRPISMRRISLVPAPIS